MGVVPISAVTILIPHQNWFIWVPQTNFPPLLQDHSISSPKNQESVSITTDDSVNSTPASSSEVVEIVDWMCKCFEMSSELNTNPILSWLHTNLYGKDLIFCIFLVAAAVRLLFKLYQLPKENNQEEQNRNFTLYPDMTRHAE